MQNKLLEHIKQHPEYEISYCKRCSGKGCKKCMNRGITGVYMRRVEPEAKAECEHEFIMRDWIYRGCRKCGLVQRKIETWVDWSVG